MKNLTLLLLLLAFSPAAFGWDLQLGYKREKPSLGAGSQSYENSGTSINFKPEPTENIDASSLLLGVQFEEWGGSYETSQWKFPTEFTPTDGTATSLDMTIKEDRLGIHYEFARELAGFYIGAGVSSWKEEVTYQGESYSYSTQEPFLRWGFDLIFGLFRIRADQINMSAGSHTIKINSLGILASF